MKLLRPVGRILILAALIAGIAGATQPASATPSTKYYTATINPNTAAAGSTYTATLVLRNSTLSTQSFGSANVNAPTGFTLTSVGPATASGGENWSAVGVSGVIQLRAATNNDLLPPGQSVSVPITATVPCSPLGPATWLSTVKQSNNFQGPPGNNFLLEPGSDYAATNVTAGGGSGVDHFEVSLPSSPFTATAGQPFTATITAKDVCGNTAIGYTGGATLSGTLGDAPNGTAQPTYGTVTAGGFANTGVATATVTPVKAETGRTITATSGTIPGTPSDLFDVQAGPADHMAFTAQPSLTKVNTAISPAVVVTLYDQFGNVATGENGNLSLTIAHDPTDPGAGNGQLSNGTVAADAGVATFPGLSVSASSNRYYLIASYGSLATVNSAFFDVVDVLAPCDSHGCQGSADNGLTGVSANVPGRNGTTGFLALGLDSAAGSVTCTRLDGTTIDEPGMGSLQTIVPPAGYTTPSIPVTVRYDKSIAPGTGVANFVFCANHGGNTPFFEIPRCPQHGQPTVKCEQSRHRNGVGDLVVTFLFSSTDPVGWGGGTP